jgi:hypothetical protein
MSEQIEELEKQALAIHKNGGQEDAVPLGRHRNAHNG